MTITIQNKLEVLLGNKVLVPGCEPTSAFTSPTLAANRECDFSVVDLDAAFTAIPTASLAAFSNPRRLFFVLPSGPPARFGTRDTSAQPDFYQILRDISDPLPPELKTIVEVDTSVVPSRPTARLPVSPISDGQICDAFPLRACGLL